LPGLKNDLKKLALFFPFLRPEEIQKMGRFRLALQTVTRNNASICSGSHYFETHNYLKNRWGPILSGANGQGALLPRWL